jgi:hypothetical protein
MCPAKPGQQAIRRGRERGGTGSGLRSVEDSSRIIFSIPHDLVQAEDDPLKPRASIQPIDWNRLVKNFSASAKPGCGQ